MSRMELMKRIIEQAKRSGRTIALPEVTDPNRVFFDNILVDECMNESFYNGHNGVIDEDEGVTSWLMIGGDPCLQNNEGPRSDGFHWCCGGNPAQLNNGLLNGPIDGVLRDYGIAALSMRYGFATPTDIGYIRVIGGK